MPIFYGEPPSDGLHLTQQAMASDEGLGENNAHDMTAKKSTSPENDGATFPAALDGRSSREMLIERLKRAHSPTLSFKCANKSPTGSPSPPMTSEIPAPTLLSSPNLGDESPSFEKQNYAAGMDIERPRSALHSGDFRPERIASSHLEALESPLSTSPDARNQGLFEIPGDQSLDRRPRSRSGLAPPTGNFVFLPPTTPLIHTSTNYDNDVNLERQRSPSPNSRRHTFSPISFQPFRSAAPSPLSSRASGSHAYQAHQPRRSISIPQTPGLRPRGSSICSDASPLQHAPMVGSYEESILRGRMSTTPSRPLDFIAQIGVLGRGKCKPSLRCPSHVTVPFPAVYYSYNSSVRPMENSPSPYVGLIDVENAFPPYEGKAPAGGCYRIPQQGQLQIIIKNPNKTAVKLFLVPYDLKDMQPGQKTFIRQRSYSAGPIIDMPVSNRKNYGTDRPEAAISHSEDPTERPVLRYLIHLNICCPSKGRYFLYRSIRVVFANRVPDGKEKLRNEVQFPEPKYSPYKMTSGDASNPNSPHPRKKVNRDISLDNAMRRRSTPFSFGTLNLDEVDGLATGQTPPSTIGWRMKPIPFSLHRLDTLDSRPGSSDRMDVDEATETSKDADLVKNTHPDSPHHESFESWLERRWNSSG